jgi:hypothetical protein
MSQAKALTIYASGLLPVQNIFQKSRFITTTQFECNHSATNAPNYEIIIPSIVDLL